jgi:hypothetical protein
LLVVSKDRGGVDGWDELAPRSRQYATAPRSNAAAAIKEVKRSIAQSEDGMGTEGREFSL